MTSPCRAIIQRLADELQEYINYAPVGPCDQEQALVDEARALLAQSEPEGPTDEELTLIYAYAVAAAVDNKRGPFDSEEAEAAQLAGLRAVLAKWGNQ